MMQLLVLGAMALAVISIIVIMECALRKGNK